VAGGTLVVADDGQLWEMAAYVEGTPIVVPAPSQIAAAMRTLATVHAAGAAIREQRPSVSASAGLAERIARAENLSVRPWRDYLRGASWSESTRFLAGRLLEASDCFESCRGVRVLSALSAAAPASLLCQVVLRDVWRDHVLFEPTELQKVVGIIDLHAAGIDTPATDVARLLGSWMPPDQPVGSSWWAEAIDAYETVRPLGRVERRLVPLLAATGIIFGIDNWFRWILIDRRHFSDQDRVAARIDRLLGILPAALKILAEAA
jgi:Ser/Thr protein kinase RdoA (MazF antagonist)